MVAKTKGAMFKRTMHSKNLFDEEDEDLNPFAARRFAISVQQDTGGMNSYSDEYYTDEEETNYRD